MEYAAEFYICKKVSENDSILCVIHNLSTPMTQR